MGNTAVNRDRYFSNQIYPSWLLWTKLCPPKIFMLKPQLLHMTVLETGSLRLLSLRLNKVIR